MEIKKFKINSNRGKVNSKQLVKDIKKYLSTPDRKK
jgi:hypothetical protein